MMKNKYNFSLEPAKNRSKTLSVILNEKKIYLHSKYNPEDEAKNFTEKYELGKFDFIIILGLGLGYVLNYIKDKTVFAVEKFNDIYKLKNYSNEYPNVNFFIDKPVETVAAAAASKFSIKQFKNFTIVELPALTKLAPDYYKKLKDLIISSINKSINNQLTFEKLSVSYNNNFYKNKSKIREIFKLNLDKKIPAVIISAGPSLEKDIEAVKKLQKKAYIFAADTAYKYLMRSNVVPDFVFSIDPQFYSYLHFKNIIPNEKTKFVFDIFSFFKLFDILGKKYKTVVSRNFLTEGVYPEKDMLDFTGGSVTNFIFYFLLKSGAEHIILTGLDLGYKDLKMYISDNYLNDYFLLRNNKTKPLQTYYSELYFERAKIRVADNIRTSNAMQGYKEYLQKKIDESDVEVSISKNSLVKLNKVKIIDLRNI